MTTMPRPTTTARINPDNRLVLAGLLVVLVAVASASFMLSFAGVSAAAPWAAIPARLAWFVPVALEVAMLGYVIAAFLRTHRGLSARLPWTLVWALTTASSTINAAHAWDAGPQGWQGIVGATLAAGFPFMRLAAAHVVAGVALGPLTDTAVEEDADTRTSVANAGQADRRTGPPSSATSRRPRSSSTARPTRRPRTPRYGTPGRTANPRTMSGRYGRPAADAWQNISRRSTVSP
ncbi:MAG: DUF2637 domain-containing protein [Cellulosimicrobium funkei]|uniref:DUF2637 domain-containing protein n=2 Tax=Cellulosimicrobium TaxID=157920 RepID=A0AAV5P2F2_CELCE|nr:DUF2637 domain-containing protein [Cellulosimicrobium cellulans]QDP75336.1 DUF2637 domain-containing protein [Cellulosimicrobium cellulans]GLY56724.1 hypothetical protein Ccel01_13260 [Cellulosimicrobium cellulans]